MRPSPCATADRPRRALAVAQAAADIVDERAPLGRDEQATRTLTLTMPRKGKPTWHDMRSSPPPSRAATEPVCMARVAPRRHLLHAHFRGNVDLMTAGPSLVFARSGVQRDIRSPFADDDQLAVPRFLGSRARRQPQFSRAGLCPICGPELRCAGTAPSGRRPPPSRRRRGRLTSRPRRSGGSLREVPRETQAGRTGGFLGA